MKLYREATDAELILITYQMATNDQERLKTFLRQNSCLVVLDESHNIKRLEGGTWAPTLIDIGAYASKRMILTGTPAPNSVVDLWSQMTFLWPNPPILGTRDEFKLHVKAAEIIPPHNAWVDAFCGSAAVTMAKTAAPIEIINDADLQIINVFRQLREHPHELIRLIELTPYAREEFEIAYRQTAATNGLEQARRFLVACMMTVNGAMGSNGQGVRHSGFSYSQAYTRNGQEARVSRWNSLPERLANVIQRLKQVRIEHRDARDLFRMFLKIDLQLSRLSGSAVPDGPGYE